MTESPREALVLITNTDQYTNIIAELREFVTVTQMLPPALALAMLPAAGRERFPNITGAVFYTDDVPAEVVDDLPPAAQLFVRAWQTRRLDKQRHGDQLPWDAPGHTPPDVVD